MGRPLAWGGLDLGTHTWPGGVGLGGVGQHGGGWLVWDVAAKSDHIRGRCGVSLCAYSKTVCEASEPQPTILLPLVNECIVGGCHSLSTRTTNFSQRLLGLWSEKIRKTTTMHYLWMLKVMG